MLRRAYELAERGRGTTSPNPLVGCVIAQDDEIVGEGFHARAGGPHAEAVALAQAGPRAAGATAYVTLEPCNHFGRTPPCSETLITRGIAGVVVGMADPNPVAIGGAVRLREASVEVEFEPDPTPFQIQNESWLHWL
ncbi:MAG: bifunctional diaminohydroxyphosphoribosylaminopyrimidine deaminase/5-amino-6-(5-phosphoribosylamino)uracil reductase RibD, partial [Coriobacteriia bacterium]|nr:bifunctional diaminohydroxyphosphoribosylaminopyrimidine deaminase/5-amino-6-(5-phosphoribosylamino)uracil reductase RibD [Coriobacteriia bacterium]